MSDQPFSSLQSGLQPGLVTELPVSTVPQFRSILSLRHVHGSGWWEGVCGTVVARSEVRVLQGECLSTFLRGQSCAADAIFFGEIDSVKCMRSKIALQARFFSKNNRKFRHNFTDNY